MKERTFYFLRDSVTKNFYTGESVDLDSFDKAAVYFQKKNAEKKMKIMTSGIYSGSWPWYEIHWTANVHPLSGHVIECAKEVKRITKLVNERKGLTNWGIEIVEISIKLYN